MTNKLWIYVRK